MRELEAVFSATMSGDEILEQLRRLGNSVPDQLWARLALLVTFDQAIYEEAVRDLSTPPYFSLITGSAGVRSFDAARNEFALTSAKRADTLAEQTDAGREDLGAFAKRMLKFLDPAAPHNRWNVLAVSVVAQPEQAATRFTELYNAADDSFDLAECSRLIEILSVRVVLNKDLDALCKSVEAYYRSRSLFVTDYYRSATYLKRSPRTNSEGKATPPVEAQFESFWSSQQTWLLNVYGKGGSGKTMFVRWLIARRCLPRRNNQTPIAVARVDFDEIDLNSFERFPEFVLGPILTQLSPQLPGRPFQTEASNFQQYAAYLKRGTPLSQASDKTIRVNINAAITSLKTELRHRSVLIVLDTCEEPLIHRKPEFERLLAIFAQVHNDCPGTLLLVSGRYRLNEKGVETHESVTAAVEVPPFTVQESRRYLTVNLGMKKGALVNAIAARGAGNPFALSLFAELVAESPKEWNAKAVREAPSADLIYLLERVILRIPQPAVRWLVRYAAIPRLLTRDFAEKVIGPWLPLHHGSDEANRFRDQRTVRRYDTRPPWPKAEFGSMSKTWDQLRAYASTPSWIIWDEETQSLKLQAEVAGPMRKLLRENAPLCATLHVEAERYFRERMKSSPAEYPRAVAEALFHAFYLRGAPADTEFCAAMKHRALAAPSDRRWLAAMVLYLLDDEGKPQFLREGELLVAPVTVLRARVALALASASLRLREGRLGTPSAMNAAKTLADQWAEIEDAAPSDLRRAASQSEVLLIRAAFRYLCRGQLINPAPLRKLALPDPLRLLARVLAARVQYERSFRGLRSSAVDFEKALELSQDSRSRDFPPSHVRYRLAMYHLRTARLAESTELFVRNFAETNAQPEWDEQRSEAFWRAIAGLRALGRWDEALRLCNTLEGEIQAGQGPAIMRFQFVHARASLALDLGTTPPPLPEVSPGATSMSEGAWFELTAEVHLRLRQIDEAEDALGKARGKYPGGSLGSDRIQVLEGVADAVAGDYAAARRAFRKPSGYWPLWLENAEAGARAAKPLPPPSQLSRVGDPALSTRAIAAGLAYGAKFPVANLLAGLKQLDDPARFAALAPFAETGEIWRGPLPSAKRLAALLPRPPRTSSVAFVTQCLALAGARRFFGDLAGAIRLLDRIPPQKEALQQWRVERSRAHSGAYRADQLAAALAGLIISHPQSALLLVTAHIEAAEWAVLHQDSKFGQSCRTFISREIERANRMGPVWRGRLALLDAGLAQLQGQTSAAREAYQEAAQKAKGQMESLRRIAVAGLKHTEPQASLGAKRAVRRNEGLEGLSRSENRPPETPAWNQPLVPPVDEFTFEMVRDDRELRIRGQLRSGAGFTQLHKPPAQLDLQKLSFLYEQLPAVVHDVAKLDDRVLKFLSPAGARLRMPTSLLTSLPWEYEAPPGQPLFYRSCVDDRENSEVARWMQLLLRELGYEVTIDAYPYQRAFLQALARFHTSGDVATLHQQIHQALPAAAQRKPSRARQGAVYINEMDRNWQREHRRGYGAVGLSLASLYRPLQPLRWQKPELPEPPGVVHLAGAFSAADHESLASHQVLYLDPGFESSPSSKVTREFGVWTPRDFSAVISALPKNIVRPLIILDALGPESTGDAAREGLRRNQFCADLFTTGAARAVLGFGLIRHDRQSECLQTLITGLREGLTIGEIHARLLGMRQHFLFPPALWTDDPYLPARIEF